MKASYRILVVEDHSIMRRVYSTLFGKADDLKLCGIVSSGEGALRELDRRTYDLAVVDFSLPGMDGIELLKRMSVRYPRLRTLMVTGHLSALKRARDAGVDAFLGKQGLTRRDLIDTVRILVEPRAQSSLRWTPAGTAIVRSGVPT